MSLEIEDFLSIYEPNVRKVRVYKSFKNIHPIIAHQIKEDERSRYLCTATSRELKMKKRCALIMSALLYELERHGFEIKSDRYYSNYFNISWMKETISITLCEKIKRVKQRLTKEERVRHWNPDQRYTFKQQPTGRLVLQVNYNVKNGRLFNVEETFDRPMEDQISEIIFKIAYQIQTSKEKRVERERLREQYEKLRLVEKEKARQVELEKQEKDILIKESKDWQTAQDLRAYITAKSQVNDASDLKFIEWKTWALGVADDLDPLKSMQ
jgi:hypothetical protein